MVLPVHVGIILDGNRRWADEKGLKSFDGHAKGFDNIKKVIPFIEKKKIKYLTLYCLSVENLKRSKEEVNYLFKLLKKGIDELKNSKDFDNKTIKFKVFGRLNLLPKNLKNAIIKLENYTSKFKGMNVNLCIGYSGHLEIVDAVKELINKKVKSEEVTPEVLKSFMYSKDSPALDLIIRTGMTDSLRLSGFMLWDSSYAEFKFRTDYWPDYSEEMFEQDLKEYSLRHRRFGK